VVQEAQQTLGIPEDRIAFSINSVRGALNWLGALSPQVVRPLGRANSVSFSRRFYCEPATFLWAVDFLYRFEGKPYGVRLFLTPERVERLCKLCILDPSGLHNVLLYTKNRSDYDRGGVFDFGTEGGFGQWILLTRPCEVPSLPEDVCS